LIEGYFLDIGAKFTRRSVLSVRNSSPNNIFFAANLTLGHNWYNITNKFLIYNLPGKQVSQFPMIISIFTILIAISIHEFAHAWVANRLGDPTARLEGRMTLNPLAHLDPIGTIALFLIGFGWGKPVPIDPYNLRQPRRDQALIALAGPITNIIFAILISFIFKLFHFTPILHTLYFILKINLALAFFNLLPLHPLDGSKVVLGFLPFETAEKWEEFLERYSLPILLTSFLPIFSGKTAVGLFLFPLINFSLQLLI